MTLPFNHHHLDTFLSWLAQWEHKYQDGPALRFGEEIMNTITNEKMKRAVFLLLIAFSCVNRERREDLSLNENREKTLERKKERKKGKKNALMTQ